MIVEELSVLVHRQFALTPTQDQEKAIEVFSRFVTDRNPHSVMILRGSAGAGKTSLASAFVRTLLSLKARIRLMAPTGRAAKVFAQNSGQKAFTIHRSIYRQRVFNGEGGSFNLNDNLHTDTVFMVDESSMIANEGLSVSNFGTGRLLDDLVNYVYSGRNCRLLLIGDRAQLPPVGEMESPALSDDRMAGYGLKVYSCDLDEVVRQSEGSGILFNATLIRRMLTTESTLGLPKIRFQGFADIQMVPGMELIEQLNSSYSEVGIDETMVITRSNKLANIYNQGIRNTVLDREDALCTGDMLMVVKNKYLDAKAEEKKEGSQEGQPTFIANGDRACVLKVRNVRELYGFHFADVWLRFPDYDGWELLTTIIMDSLATEAPALTPQQNEKLYNRVMEDYADVSRKADRVRKVREDTYYNAMQVKYGYAVTCHKAQGGQWSHVYVDQGYMTDDMLTPDYLHWLYTAFTRATDKLFLVNWPSTQTL